MLSEYLAYRLGRSDERCKKCRRRRPRGLTPDELISMRLYMYVVLLCCIAVVSAALFGHA